MGEGRIRTPVGRGRLESWRARTGGSEVAGYWVVSVIVVYDTYGKPAPFGVESCSRLFSTTNVTRSRSGWWARDSRKATPMTLIRGMACM
jgi:hypothetical protein